MKTKICTDIDQSKKLLELGIDVNTADMFYLRADIALGEIECYPNVLHREEVGDDIPAWSLAALFDVLPEGLIENYYVPNIQKENGKYSIAYGDEELLCVADNPIDACYEMILELCRQKLL